MRLIAGKAALLVAIIAAGYLLKRLHILRAEESRVISRIIIYLTLPAALISGFQSFVFDAQYLLLAPFAVACNLALLALGLLLTRGAPASTRALYALQLSSYNIGAFVLPFVQGFFPPAGLVGTSLFDAGNSPMNCGISYAVVVSATGRERVSCRFVLGQLVRSPPFMTYLFMLALSALRLSLPGPLFQLAAGIGSANTLLSMLMIGLLLELRIPRANRAQVLQILGLRYGCNLLIAAGVWMLPLPLLLRQVAILSVLAPIPSMALIYSVKLGCDEAVCGLLGSLSLVASLPLVFLSMLLWGLS